MSQFGSYFSNLQKRLKQRDVEEGPTSLSAKAFRKRVLEDDEVTPALSHNSSSLASHSGPRVAVYHDKSVRLRRSLLRISLVFIAPLLVFMIVGAIVFSTLSREQPTVPIAAESQVLSGIPIPAGVRPIARATLIDQLSSARNLFDSVLPQYNFEFKGAVSYLTPASIEDLYKYYNSKFVDPRPPPWQIFRSPTYYGDFYTAVYLRSLNNQGALEALVLRLDTVSPIILKSDPEFYDRQAKAGETAMVLWKVWLSPKG